MFVGPFFICYFLIIIQDCLSDSVKLQVFPNSEYVKQNDLLNLTCTVDSSTPIGQIAIRKNEIDIVTVSLSGATNLHNFDLSSQLIPPKSTQFVFSVQQRATILFHSGVYQCKYLNMDFATKESNKMNISVGYAPSDIEMEFLHNDLVMDVALLNENSTFVVKCKTSGETNTLTLYLDTEIIETSSPAASLSSKTYNMMTQLSEVHGKQFKCEVKNNWGSLKKTAEMLFPYAPKMESITLNGYSGPTVTVKPGAVLICEALAYPHPNVSFDPNVNVTQFNVANMITKPNEIIVQALKEKVDTTLTCVASNRVQRVVKLFYVSIDENAVLAGSGIGSDVPPSGSNDKLKSSNVVIIGVVVAALLLLSIIVIVGVLIWRHRCGASNRATSSKTSDVQYRKNDYQPVNSADVVGSSKMRDVDMDDAKGQAPVKPLRPQHCPSRVILPESDDDLNYSTLTFQEHATNQQTYAGTHFNKSSAAPLPGAYRLPVPSKHYGQPTGNGCETEYCEIVGVRPSNRF